MNREVRDHDFASIIHGACRLLLQSFAHADALGRMCLRSWHRFWQTPVAAVEFAVKFHFRRAIGRWAPVLRTMIGLSCG